MTHEGAKRWRSASRGPISHPISFSWACAGLWRIPKLSAWRRIDGGAWGPDRPCDSPALGREIQSPVGRSVSSPEAPGVGQLADGRALYQSQRSMVLTNGV